MRPILRRLVLIGTSLALAPSAVGQPRWTYVPPGTLPGPRKNPGLAYDRARSVAVMYGGVAFPTSYGDTWEWNGADWRLRTPAASPGLRNGHTLVFDARRNVTVLFGGNSTGVTLHGDTWEYDGVNWTLRATTGPSPRANHAMCYDAARGVVVLHGGIGDYIANTVLNDTWEWNGSVWTLRITSGPGARMLAGLAYDEARQRAVLFGGRDPSRYLLGDLWEWDGASWQQRFATLTPPSRADMAIAYDPLRRRTIVYAGMTNTGFDETWEWDGTSWSLVPFPPLTPHPGARNGSGACYDAVRHRVLVFGGSYLFGEHYDTWLFGEDIPGAWRLGGVGCPGLGGVPVITALGASLPLAGETFLASVIHLPPAGPTAGILGSSDAAWGSLPLPLDLSAIGMAGCRLYVSLDLVVGIANTGGAATWSLPIPNDLSLVGARFHQQVVNASAGSNPLGLVASNYGTATIGTR